MTAIDKFIRLEAVGQWHEPGEEPQEVIVSFGDATLQLASLQDVPLTHWSLLATSRIGTRGEAVIYSADPAQRETLEIDDRDMIRAISAVTSALAQPANKPHWGRWLWRGGLLAALLGGLSQSPPFIYSLASTLTPPTRMGEVSTRMQGDLRAQLGDECKGWQGMRALDAFAEKLFPDAPPTLLVFDGAAEPARALPAATVILSRQAVESAESAAALAALTVSAWAISASEGPKQALVEALGPLGALKYIITGTFPTPLPALPSAQPNGEDYLLARDHMRALGVSADTLQAMAEAGGVGLPLPRSSLPSFEFSDFATLQSICAK